MGRYEYDSKFAASDCPKGCSLCTNGTGLNSQCTACYSEYALNAPACVPRYIPDEKKDGIAWWGILIIVLSIFLSIPLIVLLIRLLFYSKGSKG